MSRLGIKSAINGLNSHCAKDVNKIVKIYSFRQFFRLVLYKYSLNPKKTSLE